MLTVAWGIFMLVLLLGAGRGIQNGVELEFRDDALNRLWIGAGRTSVDYKGLPSGRGIWFTNDDYTQIDAKVDHVDKITGRFFSDGNNLITYGGTQAPFEVRGVHPDNLFLEKTIISHGRYLNDLDIEERRKICVIGAQVAARLFENGPDDALGKTLRINNSSFVVVGVFNDLGNRREEERLYVPITTAQLLSGAANELDELLYTVGDASYQQSKQSEQQVRELLSRRHKISPDDKRALKIYNNLDEYKKITDLFYWVRVFVAVVGVGTVLTGILAVSNIMVISVSERRREIGIRKALGAPPGSITRLIVFESLLLTAAAGYLGLIASIGLLELLKATIEENEYMYQPDVSSVVIVSVTVLVVLAGTLAGYLPARRAAAISPVEALQQT